MILNGMIDTLARLSTSITSTCVREAAVGAVVANDDPILK